MDNRIQCGGMDITQTHHFSQTNYLACKARARKLVQDRLRVLNGHYQFKYARVSIKDLHTRWGSCSQKKNLNFHYKILFLAPELVDYVIAHELCHLAEMNHSYNFWKLVARTIPDFKKKILQLRRIEREIQEKY